MLGYWLIELNMFKTHHSIISYGVFITYLENLSIYSIFPHQILVTLWKTEGLF